MSEAIDWGWIRATLRQTQAEQRALRGLIEPLAPRLSALEARFSALEARISGIEESVNGIGLTVRQQSVLLTDIARKLDARTTGVSLLPAAMHAINTDYARNSFACVSRIG